MLTKTALIVAALGATASAQMRSPALLARATRTLETASEELPTESTSPECESRIESWTENFPTPAPALEDALENADDSESGQGADGIEGLCDFAAGLPSTAAAAFTSYNLDMYSYLSAQSSNLLALATSCSTDMGAEPSIITSQLDELLDVYSSFSAGACADVTVTTDSVTSSSATKTASKFGITSLATSTSTGSAAATASSASGSSSSGSAASSGSSANASSSPTSVSQNAGPRETGMLAAAAIAMGVLGAAVAL